MSDGLDEKTLSDPVTLEALRAYHLKRALECEKSHEGQIWAAEHNTGAFASRCRGRAVRELKLATFHHAAATLLARLGG